MPPRSSLFLYAKELVVLLAALPAAENIAVLLAAEELLLPILAKILVAPTAAENLFIFLATEELLILLYAKELVSSPQSAGANRPSRHSPGGIPPAPSDWSHAIPAAPGPRPRRCRPPRQQQQPSSRQTRTVLLRNSRADVTTLRTTPDSAGSPTTETNVVVVPVAGVVGGRSE